jgi:phospholipase C
MRRQMERTYGRMARGVMVAVNPVKKMAVKTHCVVHKYINIQAVEILKNDGYDDAYIFYKKHIKHLNDGVTWADQDFKSTNHFYHYKLERGLYGFSNALVECQKYYEESIRLIKNGEEHKGLFFLGASVHLIQDMTVPHHVNNRLLKSHRKFELWIIDRLFKQYNFSIMAGTKRYNSVEEFIKNNAKFANSVHHKYMEIEDTEQRYYKVAREILREAQITTAGYLLFYYDTVIMNYDKEKDL